MAHKGFKPPFDQGNLKERHLLMILDVLHENEAPMKVTQIQYRLGADRNVTMSREEIEEHLQWGWAQPNATSAPFQPIKQPHGDLWTIRDKHPLTPEQHRAAGSMPFKTYSNPAAHDYQEPPDEEEEEECDESGYEGTGPHPSDWDPRRMD